MLKASSKILRVAGDSTLSAKSLITGGMFVRGWEGHSKLSATIEGAPEPSVDWAPDGALAAGEDGKSGALVAAGAVD
jgi:hypothetical protein